MFNAVIEVILWFLKKLPPEDHSSYQGQVYQDNMNHPLEVSMLLPLLWQEAR